MQPSAKQPRGVPITAKRIGIFVFSFLVSSVGRVVLQDTQDSQRHHESQQGPLHLSHLPSHIQLQMIFNGLLHLPGLDTDVPLGHSCAAVLQELLHQGDVIPVVPVDLRGIELAEAVGADALDVQVVAHQLQLLLDRPLRQREDNGVGGDAVVNAVAADKLI